MDPQIQLLTEVAILFAIAMPLSIVIAALIIARAIGRCTRK